MADVPKMPLPAPEQQQHFQKVSEALTKAEVALGACMGAVVRTGQSVAEITKSFPEIARLADELESALRDFVEAGYRGDGAHIGPLHTIRDTETRMKDTIAKARDFAENYGKGTTTPASADKATVERELERIKGKA